MVSNVQSNLSFKDVCSLAVLRFMAIVPAAIVVTVFLIYSMMEMITFEMVVIDESPRTKISPFVLEPVKPEAPVVEPLDPPQPVERAPEVEFTLFPDDNFRDQVSVDPQGPMVFDDTDKGVIDFTHTGLVKTSSIGARYPQKALANGIEGYVDVEFDIPGTGIPQNIKVITAEPAGYFESAAKSAVIKWRYQVPAVDGLKETIRSHSERIRFELARD